MAKREPTDRLEVDGRRYVFTVYPAGSPGTITGRGATYSIENEDGKTPEAFRLMTAELGDWASTNGLSLTYNDHLGRGLAYSENVHDWTGTKGLRDAEIVQTLKTTLERSVRKAHLSLIGSEEVTRAEAMAEQSVAATDPRAPNASATITKEQAIRLLQLGIKDRPAENAMLIFGLNMSPSETTPLYKDADCIVPLDDRDRRSLDDKVAFVGGYENLMAEELIEKPGVFGRHQCFVKHALIPNREGTPDYTRTSYTLMHYRLNIEKIEAIAGMTFEQAGQRTPDRNKDTQRAR